MGRFTKRLAARRALRLHVPGQEEEVEDGDTVVDFPDTFGLGGGCGGGGGRNGGGGGEEDRETGNGVDGGGGWEEEKKNLFALL